MADQKNIFISHVHEDDNLLPKLKDLIGRAGMEVRDGSINSNKPNEAQNEDYIKREILAPRIQWASTLVVLITHDTAQSDWVNWEIKYAIELGKNVVGVFAQGATDADIPEELRKHGDAAVVGWQGDRVVDAINGKIRGWDDPVTGNPRTTPDWVVKRYSCG
ncbi:TIR domain-containing protein [Sorangium sp. So ce363]|uniref:TIR domain-containing protein n=1 Tax=Sorangium sp. So ce363 TaxID=3133304 RepID=UPI003F62FEA1